MNKLVPEVIGILDRQTRRFMRARVVRVQTHLPGTFDKSVPIRPELTAVEIITAHGTRWYGCKRAWITSALRMAVELCDGAERDEVVAKWEDA